MKVRVAFVALAAACQGPASPGASHLGLVNGTVDPGDPAVVMVEAAFGGLCSGSVVSPHVVLTAAHCLPASSVAFGPSDTEVSARLEVIRYDYHPMFDIAMVTLAEVAPVAPVPMNRAFLVPYVGQRVRLVGFGLTDELAEDSGIRRQGMTTLLSLNEEEMWTDFQDSALCFGDSGGPAFMTIEGVEVVVGVASRLTRFECGAGPSASVRTDTAIEWLEAYVIANEPSEAPSVAVTSPADGDQVPPGFPVTAEASDDHSVARVELRVDGEVHDVDSEAPYQLNALAGVEFGSHQVEARAYDTGGQDGRSSLITVAVGAACSGPDDCSGDDECQGGRCLHPLGGSCETHAECASGMCGAIAGAGHCTTPCDPFSSGDCPSGFECRMPDLPGAAGQCLPGGESSGCALPSRRPSSAGWTALLLLVALWLLRRATSSASAAPPRS